MDKLATIAAETALFLRMVIQDVDRSIVGTWIAKDFDNDSVDFTAQYMGNVSAEQVMECRHALADTMTNFLQLEGSKVSRATRLQYAKIAKPIDPDETVHFGLLDESEQKKPSEWHILSKEVANEIEQRLTLSDRIEFEGSLQGKIHSFFKEAERPHFRLRELYSDDLITCYYNREKYDDVARALQKRETVIHVGGWVVASRTSRKILWMIVSRIEEAEEYREGDLDKFIGCAPNATGDLTTEEFLYHIRNEEEFA
jgi:hypothetical protein